MSKFWMRFDWASGRKVPPVGGYRLRLKSTGPDASREEAAKEWAHQPYNPAPDGYSILDEDGMMVYAQGS